MWGVGPRSHGHYMADDGVIYAAQHWLTKRNLDRREVFVIWIHA